MEYKDNNTLKNKLFQSFANTSVPENKYIMFRFLLCMNSPEFQKYLEQYNILSKYKLSESEIQKYHKLYQKIKQDYFKDFSDTIYTLSKHTKNTFVFTHDENCTEITLDI